LGEKEEIVDFSAHWDKPQVVAFFTDTEHEVKPVTRGYRITFTADIELDDKPHGPLNREINIPKHFGGTDKQTPMAHLFDRIKCHADQNQGHVNFMLLHKYTEGSVHLGLLKGSDLAISEYLKSKGVSCKPISVVMHHIPIDDEEPHTEISSSTMYQLSVHSIIPSKKKT